MLDLEFGLINTTKRLFSGFLNLKEYTLYLKHADNNIIILNIKDYDDNMVFECQCVLYSFFFSKRYAFHLEKELSSQQLLALQSILKDQ
jgi:hypothetical protein